MILELLFVYGP